MGVFIPNFAFWTKIFGEEENFLAAQNLGRGNCPPALFAPCHDATAGILLHCNSKLTAERVYKLRMAIML